MVLGLAPTLGFFDDRSIDFISEAVVRFDQCLSFGPTCLFA